MKYGGGVRHDPKLVSSLHAHFPYLHARNKQKQLKKIIHTELIFCMLVNENDGGNSAPINLRAALQETSWAQDTKEAPRPRDGCRWLWFHGLPSGKSPLLCSLASVCKSALTPARYDVFILGNSNQFVSLALPQCCLNCDYQQQNKSGQDRAPWATCAQTAPAAFVSLVRMCGLVALRTVVTSYGSILWSAPITVCCDN